MAITISLSLTISDDTKGQEMLDAFCRKYGWTVDSGLTQRQFTKREVIEFFRAPWIKEKEEAGKQSTRIAVQNEINSVTIT